MIRLLNSAFKKLGFQLIGIGSVEKLSRTSFKNDAFQVQKELIKKTKPMIFDIGANRGDISAKYQQLYKKATIHAFEPFPDTYKILYENSKITGCISNNLALDEQPGEKCLYINKSVDTNSFLESSRIGASSDEYCRTVDKLVVQTTSIDVYCLKNKIATIDIMKLDVQGAELMVLKGSKFMLEQKRIKLIYTEVYFKQQYKDQPLFSDLEVFLREYGYILVDLYNLYYNANQILWGDAIFIEKSVLS